MHTTYYMEIYNDQLAYFCQYPITGDVAEVPGVTPDVAKLLLENGVQNTFNLIGKYLSFRGLDITTRQHHDLFLDWMKSAKIPEATSMQIMMAVAEKISSFMPGIYDPAMYAE